jgi:hypothetical protein
VRSTIHCCRQYSNNTYLSTNLMFVENSNHYIALVAHWVTHKQQHIRHRCHKLWTREASTRERGGPEYNKFITSLVIQSHYKRMWVFAHKRTQPMTHEDKFCGFIHYIVQYAVFIVTYISLWTLNFMIAIYLQMRVLNLLVNMYYLALFPFFLKVIINYVHNC